MERNSERLGVYITIGLAVLGAIGAVLQSVLDAGILEKDSTGYVIIGCIVSVAVAVAGYANSRGTKKAAEASANAMLTIAADQARAREADKQGPLPRSNETLGPG